MNDKVNWDKLAGSDGKEAENLAYQRLVVVVFDVAVEVIEDA